MRDKVFPEIVPIETKRLCLRKIDFRDAENLLECLSDPRVTDSMMHCRVTTMVAIEERIAAYLREYALQSAARFGVSIRGEDELLGSVLLCSLERKLGATLGFYLHPSVWGRGYATEAVSAALAFGFRESGLIRIEGSCFAENLASARVMEKCGMQCEGMSEGTYFVRGEKKDVLQYTILKEEWEALHGGEYAAGQAFGIHG